MSVVSRVGKSLKTTCRPSVRTKTYWFAPCILIFVSSTWQKGLSRILQEGGGRCGRIRG